MGFREEALASIDISQQSKPLNNVSVGNLSVRTRLVLYNLGQRLFDIVASSIILLVSTPLLLFLVLVIKLESPGGALFRQQRLGLNGRPFTFLKLRTMYEDSDPRLAKYLSDFPEVKQEWHKYAKLKSYDPRVTKCGIWLRKSSFNELPQLINVIKGDMSLIGPRPYLPYELPEMGEYADVILSIRPGITGLWQVCGRNEIAMTDRVQIEAWYVHNRNWCLDVRILFKTVPAVLSQRGAY